jgi:hypothetical protein
MTVPREYGNIFSASREARNLEEVSDCYVLKEDSALCRLLLPQDLKSIISTAGETGATCYMGLVVKFKFKVNV